MIRRLNICLLLCFGWNAFVIDRAKAGESDLPVMADAVRAWQRADGLPSDLVTTAIQTRDRFLWVGTSAGLVRFDGVTFTPVRLAVVAGNPVYITALCEDGDGGLWIGTQHDGLFRLANGRTRHFARRDGLLDDDVTCVALDKQGRIWVGGKSGLSVWNGHEFQRFDTRDGLPDEYISSVHVARSGTVWITTRTGMCRFIDGRITSYDFQARSQGRSPEYLGAYEDRNGNLWAFGDTYLINLAEGKRFNYFHSSESPSVRIWSLCEGRDGRLWIGTSGPGLFCFEDGRFQPVVLGGNRGSYDVRSICEDAEGNLWLGTYGGGLLQLRPQSVRVFQAGEGLVGGPPTALALDARGRVFVGLRRGGLFTGEAGRFERVDDAGLAIQIFISTLSVTGDGTLWAGTLGDGLLGLQKGRGIQLTTANGLADDHVLAVCADESDTVWISTADGALQFLRGTNPTRIETLPRRRETPVTALVPAATGGLWLGTADGLVLRADNGKSPTNDEPTDLGHYSVLALYEGKESGLWVGTDGGGLTLVSGGLVFHWSTDKGLPNATVAGLAEDNAGNLWLATGAGIYRVGRNEIHKALANPQISLECKLMSPAKTMSEPGTSFCGTRAALASDGTLWFATSDGVLRVDTRQSEITPVDIPLYLESATFNGKPPISLDSEGQPSPGGDIPATAPMDLKAVEIRFTAPGFTAPAEIRFRHKLDGFDPDWVDDSTTRFAHYGRLSYGDYRFHVAIRNADGEWQEARRTFAFVVPTPLYFQTWAIGTYAAVVIGLIAGIVRLVSDRRLRTTLARLEQQQSLERERMRIARDLHDEMGSKLAKISFLSEHAQVGVEANGPLAGKLKSIAGTTRDLLRTMDEIVWVVNPRNDTLENLVAYLSHYAVEYFQNTSIQCDLQLPRDIPSHGLSSEARHNLFLTFEETLNNALRHADATKVTIEMSAPAPEFEIKVMDNGRGFVVPAPAAPAGATRGRGGNGLKNMRQRLAEVGGECQISSEPGKGTTVKIRIRLSPKTNREP